MNEVSLYRLVFALEHQEERQKAQEEMLDDKRIRAVENIVNQAVAKLTEMFKPSIDAIFAPPPETQPPTTPQEQPKRRWGLNPSAINSSRV